MKSSFTVELYDTVARNFLHSWPLATFDTRETQHPISTSPGVVACSI